VSKPPLTVEEARALLKLPTRRAVYDYVRRHRIPNRDRGRRLLLDEDDLLRPRETRPLDVDDRARLAAARDHALEQAHRARRVS
jgi:curved DNA-binding protein CbpA